MANAVVVFESEGKKVSVSIGTTIFQAAREADVGIRSECGGKGLCGKCKVRAREILVDMIPTKAGHYKEVRTFEKCFGGAPFNFAVGITRLGGDAGAICAVGNDQFGEFLVDTLKENRVDTTYVKVKKARTTLAFVVRDVTGERNFFFYREPWTKTADTLLSPDDIEPEYISKAKILHFSGVALSHNPERSAVLKAIK